MLEYCPVFLRARRVFSTWGFRGKQTLNHSHPNLLCAKAGVLWWSRWAATHLHGVDCALGNDTGQGPCHKPLRDAQGFLVAADQTLNLDRPSVTDQQTSRVKMKTSFFFFYMYSSKSSYLLIGHELQGRLWSNFDDIHAISSPQRPHSAFFNHLHQASHEAHVAGSTPMNLRRKAKSFKLKYMTRVPQVLKQLFQHFGTGCVDWGV